MSLIYCPTCGIGDGFIHDHKPDGSGLDDGPFLPGCAPRKRPPPKSPEELRAIRAKAWETRRAALSRALGEGRDE